jgi:putative ABC transport system permease protein
MNKIYVKLWRDIVAQKWQFTALVMVILLGVVSYGGMMGMIGDVEASLDRTLDELRFQDFVVTLQGTAPEDVVADVAGVENVEAATGRFVMDTGLDLGEENQGHTRLVGITAGEEPAVNQLYIQEGRGLQEGDGMVAVIDHHLAEYYGYGPGTVLEPIVDGERVEVEIVGVAVSPEYLMAVASAENVLPQPGTFTALFMPRDAVQRLFGAEGQINEVNVRVADRSPEAVARAIAGVEQALGEGQVRDVVERADNPSYNLLMLDLEGGREMMGAVPSMFVVIAAMSIYVLLSRMVQAQRPQIGVIKALGYSRWAVMRYYLLYAGLIAAIGSTLGFILSYPVGQGFAQAYAAEFGLPFVTAKFHVEAGLEAIGLNVVVALVAAVFPAWESARIPPAQAMRFDPSVAQVRGSVPWVERVLGRTFHLRTSTKIAVRNLFRNTRRTLTTMLGFVFAFVVLLACWAMFDGMDYMMEVQFERTDRWDVQALFSQPKPVALMGQIANWPGVNTVEPSLQMPATVAVGGEAHDAYVVALRPDSQLHGFQLPRDVRAEEILAPGHALLATNVAEQWGVETGDRITLETPLGDREVVADTRNEEVMSSAVYVSLDWAEEEMPGGQTLFNALWLEVDPAQRADVRRMLYNVPGVASVDLKEQIADGWQALMGLYYVMMGMFLLFALGIAAAVIFNTMTVNVMERQREIATMRALGQSRGRLRAMITLENVLVGLLALVPGLAIGVGATYYLFQVFSGTADFYLPFHIAPQTYVLVTALIFGTALLSQIPALRRANRMDLAEATKVMT